MGNEQKQKVKKNKIIFGEWDIFFYNIPDETTFPIFGRISVQFLSIQKYLK